MKNRQFWINVILYLAILLGMLHLYFPYNNKPENQSKSTVQFVYQQF